MEKKFITPIPEPKYYYPQANPREFGAKPKYYHTADQWIGISVSILFTDDDINSILVSDALDLKKIVKELIKAEWKGDYTSLDLALHHTYKPPKQNLSRYTKELVVMITKCKVDIS